MSAFPDWQKYAVKQKRNETGCIPTGYEMILRAADCKNVNFETFQDEFDLDKNLRLGERPQNNFESVADAVKTKYPDIQFKHIGFEKGEGQKKLAAVEKMISQKLPVLISLALAPFGGRGWHIMPVVDSNEGSLTLLWVVDDKLGPQTKTITKTDFVRVHESCEGGNDIAFLERSQNAPASANIL